MQENTWFWYFLQHVTFHHKFAIITTLSIGFSLVAFRKFVKGSRYYGTERIDGKTVIITGGNTGIGKETAIDLAKRGARIIIACRDVTKGNCSAQEIKEKSGNKETIVKKLDLASLKSIRCFAEDINKTEKSLDILINNAGVMECPYWKTEDGFEMQFGVNHLGHFLLTHLLLDLIKKSAPSRIVTVSSFAHKLFGQINFDDINREKHYNSTKAYAHSKLANILFTRELAKRLQGTGVSTYCLHPGVVKTELGRHWKKKSFAFFRELVYFIVANIFIKTSEEGAQTSIFCAVDDSLENETGKYYSDCAEKLPSKAALDDGAATKLWELSERLVGVQS